MDKTVDIVSVEDLPPEIAVADTPLTPEETIFAEVFAATFDNIRAYREAFKPPLNTRQSQLAELGREVHLRPHVKQRIGLLERESPYFMEYTKREAIARCLAIIRGNVNELVSYRIGCCRHCHGVGHAYQWRITEYMAALGQAELTPGSRLPDPSGGFDYDETRGPLPTCPHCNGQGVGRVELGDTTQLSPDAMALYGGVKTTKDGTQVIIADKFKAMEMALQLSGVDTGKGMSVEVNVNALIQQIRSEAVEPEKAQQRYLDMVQRRLTPPS